MRSRTQSGRRSRQRFAIDAVPAHVAVFRSIALAYVATTALSQALTIHASRRLARAETAPGGDLGRAARLGALLHAPACFAFVLAVAWLAGKVMGVDVGGIGELAP